MKKKAKEFLPIVNWENSKRRYEELRLEELYHILNRTKDEERELKQLRKIIYGSQPSQKK